MTTVPDFDFSALLGQGAAALDLRLDGAATERLHRYFQELKKWNRKVNLVARDTSDQDLVEKHFLDSLTLLLVLERHGTANGSLLDVGSGAGFPGLVLAASRPGLPVTLVEPRAKRAAFLRHVARCLELDKVAVIETRIEDLAPPAAPFRWITSRAVAEPARFLPMVGHLLGPGTLVICMLGRDQGQGLAFDLTALGFEENQRVDLELPFSKGRRCLYCCQRRVKMGGLK